MGEETEALCTSAFRHKCASQLSTSLTFRAQSTHHVILWACCRLGTTASCAQLTHSATRCRVPKGGRLWGCSKDPAFSKDSGWPQRESNCWPPRLQTPKGGKVIEASRTPSPHPQTCEGKLSLKAEAATREALLSSRKHSYCSDSSLHFLSKAPPLPPPHAELLLRLMPPQNQSPTPSAPPGCGWLSRHSAMAFLEQRLLGFEHSPEGGTQHP